MAFLGRSYDGDGNKLPGGRKLIRSRVPESQRSSISRGIRGTRNKPPPPELTGAENFYYLKQIGSKTPMVIVMLDGEKIRGCIEWYDRNCLKVNRDDAPNLLIQKRFIKYLFKEDEELPG